MEVMDAEDNRPGGIRNRWNYLSHIHRLDVEKETKMINFTLGCIIGLIVGANLSLIAYALCVASGIASQKEYHADTRLDK
jgi:hypothetical protein